MFLLVSHCSGIDPGVNGVAIVTHRELHSFQSKLGVQIFGGIFPDCSSKSITNVLCTLSKLARPIIAT